MYGSHVRAFLYERRRVKRAFSIVAACCCFISAASHGGERASNLGISITIVEVEVTRLPVSVQRLNAIIPGYGNAWSHAREITRTNPVGAIHLVRALHVRSLGETGAAASAAIEADMIAAGQALFTGLPR